MHLLCLDATSTCLVLIALLGKAFDVDVLLKVSVKYNMELLVGSGVDSVPKEMIKMKLKPDGHRTIIYD